MKPLPRVPVSKIRIGHFVVLEGSWSAHPFLRNRFRVDSPHDLQR